MPDVTGTGLPTSQVPGDLLTKFDGPAPDGLIGHVDAALQQHLFNLTQAQVETDVQPHCVSDDLGWEAVTFVADRRCVHHCQLCPNCDASNRTTVYVIAPAPQLSYCYHLYIVQHFVG